MQMAKSQHNTGSKPNIETIWYLLQKKSYIHSPDPYYQQKMDHIALYLLKAWYEPEKYVFLYQDEFTYHLQPTLDRDYEQMGEFQPLARRSYNSDTAFRGIGALGGLGVV